MWVQLRIPKLNFRRITFAASTTNLHQLITATATTRTHHHTQGDHDSAVALVEDYLTGTTRAHQPLTEGEKRAGVGERALFQSQTFFDDYPMIRDLIIYFSISQQV